MSLPQRLNPEVAARLGLPMDLHVDVDRLNSSNFTNQDSVETKSATVQASPWRFGMKFSNIQTPPLGDPLYGCSCWDQAEVPIEIRIDQQCKKEQEQDQSNNRAILISKRLF